MRNICEELGETTYAADLKDIFRFSVISKETNSFIETTDYLTELKKLENNPNINFDCSDYAVILDDIYTIYKEKDRKELANVVEYLIRKLIKIDDYSRISYLYQLAGFYKELGQKDKATECEYDIFQLKTHKILRHFLITDNSLRNYIWDSECNYIRDIIEPHMTDPAYASMIYDVALFTKGIMLAHDVEITNAFESYRKM